MRREAKRLADYCQDRLGDALRGVGYHTTDGYEVVYIRDDVTEDYPQERVDNFIRSSRSIHESLNTLDEMGRPEASLHLLEEAMIVQFHFPGEGVIFVAMDEGVGRNFSKFVDDCLDQIS